MDASQTLIFGLPGPDLTADYAKTIKEVQPGGFILFSRNIKNPLQLRKLMDDIRSICKYSPFFLIDQEGGRVARLREMGTEPPSIREIVTYGTNDDLKTHGILTGKLLKLFGFNLNLCPVVDISVDGDLDNSLKNRCFGLSASEVNHRAQIFNKFMQGEGILSCAKHFPGYSCAKVDPHHDLPVINKSREEMENFEWQTFRHFVNKVDAFMMGHGFYPKVDPVHRPSSLSPFFINEILRGEWGFKGLVVTDDLDMGAILNFCSFADSLKLSLEAGNDLLLICHRSEMMSEAKKVVDALPTKTIDRALLRITEARKKFAPLPTFSLDAYNEIDQAILELRIKVLGSEMAYMKTPEDAKRSPVEEY
jgi:beta-N-acetylhexosaminidase